MRTIISRITSEGAYQAAAPRAGDAEVLHDMLAHRTAPGEKGTDHNFLQGRDNHQSFNKMPEQMRKFYLDRAKAAGVNINGKVYISGLARKGYAGDPQAWVADTSDAKRVALANGKNIEGAVNATADPRVVDQVQSQQKARYAAMRKARSKQNA